MMPVRLGILFLCSFFLLQCSLVHSTTVNPEVPLQQLDSYPHARQIAFSRREVLDHEIGLGAIQKMRGEWRFKRSERLSGTLASYTWQVVDGFSSAQVMEDLLENITADDRGTLLFACSGRACGKGVQWANRVFREQVLYGREDLQQYRVYDLPGEPSYRLTAYSSERTTDRQYLHVELLRIAN
jgi:hypothetical protein